MAVAMLALAGCSFGLPSSVRYETPVQKQDVARHIEIEVDDPSSGLPCRVVDRPDADTRTILWRAEHEHGFCHRKAEETRFILESRGWVCQPDDARNNGAAARLVSLDRSPSPRIVAAWRCFSGLPPIARHAPEGPPIPEARPDQPTISSDAWTDERLRAAVKRDLAVIGQDDLDEETMVDAALGDLDGDGISDAVVALTHETGLAAPYRLLMAYLQSDGAYNLVDVWILDMAGDPVGSRLSLAIEDGRVRLDRCCEGQVEPTVLVLDNRKLAHAQGG